MAYSQAIAIDLIGKERTNDFQCNHVVNEVLTGTKYGRLAKDYLNYGKVVTKPEAGAFSCRKRWRSWRHFYKRH